MNLEQFAMRATAVLVAVGITVPLLVILLDDDVVSGVVNGTKSAMLWVLGG